MIEKNIFSGLYRLKWVTLITVGGALACQQQSPAFREKTTKVAAPKPVSHSNEASTGERRANDGGPAEILFPAENVIEALPAPSLDVESDSTLETIAAPTDGNHTPTVAPPRIINITENSSVSFAQQADILWIIDSSGSMSEEQAQLSKDLPAFYQRLLELGIDFQTAITSTDVCPDSNPAGTPLNSIVCPTTSFSKEHLRGSFVGASGAMVIPSDDMAGLDLFTSYIKVGTEGSGFEHGLWAANLALHKSVSGENPAFVRNAGHLAVIVVSDEEDDGIGLGTTNENGTNYVASGKTLFKFDDRDFVSQTQTLFTDKTFSVSGIVGTRNANGTLCKSNIASPLEEGTQYIRAAAGTSGVIQSICTPDWPKTLIAIANNIRSRINSIRLSHIPLAGSISVRVNRAEYLDWKYLPISNSIEFLNADQSGAKAEITIEYRTIEVN